ncbi:hypothetical protein NH340_JMT04840 [Sarcoptes scabiei]|nr:hypothetical protein NH340_JMT04840 [Sarcoptes scabiei]
MQHSSGLPKHMQRFRPPIGGSNRRNELKKPFGFGSKHRINLDFNPSCWSDYFTSKKDIAINDNDVFRIYFNQTETDLDTKMLVLLHGGGFSGLTWALFAKNLVGLCHINIMAIDIRGHGSSKTSEDSDLSVQTIVNDITEILKNVFQSSMPELILMGHSMGGALATHFVDKCSDEWLRNRVIGLIVIDVVEGTAKDSLSQMQQVLHARPNGFRSVQHAIEWCIKSGQVKNLEAAKISMIGQISHKKNGICAVDMAETEIQEIDEKNDHNQKLSRETSFGLTILDENSVAENGNHRTLSDSTHNQTSNEFVWRIDLSKTEPYWMEWFTGLNQVFLSSKGGAKLLILAGVDRLDGPMTVGQMQGKFQMQILPKVGHVIQEDDPDSVAQIVAHYLVRNRFSKAKIELDHFFPSC